MKLIGNKILVERDRVTQWKGIHIPEDITHMNNPFTEERIARVVAIGTGRRTKKGALIPISGINVGDRVLLPNQNKRSIDVSGKQYWMIDADEILGVLDAT